VTSGQDLNDLLWQRRGAADVEGGATERASDYDPQHIDWFRPGGCAYRYCGRAVAEQVAFTVDAGDIFHCTELVRPGDGVVEGCAAQLFEFRELQRRLTGFDDVGNERVDTAQVQRAAVPGRVSPPGAETDQVVGSARLVAGAD